jgi:hypothetical protein
MDRVCRRADHHPWHARREAQVVELMASRIAPGLSGIRPLTRVMEKRIAIKATITVYDHRSSGRSSSCSFVSAGTASVGGWFFGWEELLTLSTPWGSRTALLPDFYIGAHAAIGGLALLTRDPARYRGYFPKVEILAPAKHGM